jgi:hypothetical protein
MVLARRSSHDTEQAGSALPPVAAGNAVQLAEAEKGVQDDHAFRNHSAPD